MTYYNIYLNDVLINEFPVQENYLDGLLGVCMRYNIGSCFRVSPVLKEPETTQSVKDEPVKNADELLEEADWLLNLVMPEAWEKAISWHYQYERYKEHKKLIENE